MQAVLNDPSVVLYMDGNRHRFLAAVAGWMWDGVITEQALFCLLRSVCDRYCANPAEKSDKWIRQLVRWVMKKQPCTEQVSPMGE